jgi:hypothetical protein
MKQFRQAEIVALGLGTHDSEEFPGYAALLLKGQVVQALQVHIQDPGSTVGPLYVAADPKE